MIPYWYAHDSTADIHGSCRIVLSSWTCIDTELSSGTGHTATWICWLTFSVVQGHVLTATCMWQTLMLIIAKQQCPAAANFVPQITLLLLPAFCLPIQNNGFWSLQDSALQYYYNFCHQYEAAGLNLDSLVDSICATWAPYLDHDEYLAIKAPKETEQTKHGLMGVFSGLSMSKKGSLKHDRKNQLTGRVSHAGFSGYGGMRSRATSRATSRANSHAGGVMTLEAERSGVLAVEDAVVF